MNIDTNSNSSHTQSLPLDILRNLVLSQVHKTKYILYFVLIVNAKVMLFSDCQILKAKKDSKPVVAYTSALNRILCLLGFHIVLKWGMTYTSHVPTRILLVRL